MSSISNLPFLIFIVGLIFWILCVFSENVRDGKAYPNAKKLAEICILASLFILLGR